MAQAIYAYRGIGPDGLDVSGMVEAQNENAALAQLSLQNLHVYELRSATERHANQGRTETRSLWSPATLGWRLDFYRQLSVMLQSGVNLDRALSLLQSQAPKPWEKTVLQALERKVASGISFSESLKQTISTAATEEITLIRISQRTGNLAKALAGLADGLARRQELTRRITSALVYPAFLLFLAPVSLLIVATVLVPNIAPLFENSDAEMPFVLQLMVILNHQLSEYGAMWIAILAAVVFSAAIMLRKPKTRRKFGDLVSGLPLFAKLRQLAFESRFCRGMESLLLSGATLQSAVIDTSDLFSRSSSKSKFSEIVEAMSSGQRFSVALNRSGLLQPATLNLIAVGEETNQLETMLAFAAFTAEVELQTRTERLMTLLVPVLTLLLGILIGGIMMSVMRAILAVNQLAAQ